MMLLELLNEVVDIDTDIFLSFNRMHSPFFDYFMSTYSEMDLDTHVCCHLVRDAT